MNSRHACLHITCITNATLQMGRMCRRNPPQYTIKASVDIKSWSSDAGCNKFPPKNSKIEESGCIMLQRPKKKNRPFIHYKSSLNLSSYSDVTFPPVTFPSNSLWTIMLGMLVHSSLMAASSSPTFCSC